MRQLKPAPSEQQVQQPSCALPAEEAAAEPTVAMVGDLPTPTNVTMGIEPTQVISECGGLCCGVLLAQPVVCCKAYWRAVGRVGGWCLLVGGAAAWALQLSPEAHTKTCRPNLPDPHPAGPEEYGAGGEDEGAGQQHGVIPDSGTRGVMCGGACVRWMLGDGMGMLAC